MLFMLPITDNAQDPMRAYTRQRNGIPLTGTGGCKNKKKKEKQQKQDLLGGNCHYAHNGRLPSMPSGLARPPINNSKMRNY